MGNKKHQIRVVDGVGHLTHKAQHSEHSGLKNVRKTVILDLLM